MKRAAFAILVSLSAIGCWLVVALCPSGAPGNTCRTLCASQCYGHEECSVDECGLLTCACSGHGDLDPVTGLCRCDVGHTSTMNGTDCQFAIPPVDCKQSQTLAQVQTPVIWSVCSSGVINCTNGATPYSPGSFSSDLQPVTDCNPANLGPYSLHSSNPSGDAPSLVMTRGYQFDMTMADATFNFVSGAFSTSPARWMYFTFIRRSRSSNLFSIHSSFDLNRTLEIETVGGVQTVRLSASQLQTPTLWLLSSSPLLWTAFQIASSSDPTLFLSRSASPSGNYGSGTVVLSSTPTNWYLDAKVGIFTQYLPGNSLIHQNSNITRPAFSVLDPLACFDHCRRDVLCYSATVRDGKCYMLAFGLSAPVSCSGHVCYSWVVSGTPRPFLIDGISGTATECLIPGLGPGCTATKVGPVRLQSGLDDVSLQHSAHTVSVVMSTSQILWCGRGGMDQNDFLGASIIVGSPNWYFVNVDNGNEWIIFPQGSASTVLGIDVSGAVAIIPYVPNAPTTWFRNGTATFTYQGAVNITISDAFSLALSSSPKRRLGTLNGQGGYSGPLSVSTRSASAFFVSTFRWAFNDNDPLLAGGHNGTFMNGNNYQTFFSVSILHCYSSCIQDPQCNGLSWSSTTLLCYLFNWPYRQQRAVPQAATADFYSISRTAADTLFTKGTWTSNQGCANGAFDTSQSPQSTNLWYPDMYSWREPSPSTSVNVLANVLTVPLWQCATPLVSFITITTFAFETTGDDPWYIQKSNGQGVYIAPYNTGTSPMGSLGTVADPVDTFVFRYTGDAAGVFEIVSAVDPYRTLQIERAGVPDGHCAPSLPVVMQDVRPNAAHRWRCYPWPACEIIESFEEPGRLLAACGSSPGTFGQPPVALCATYQVTYAQHAASGTDFIINLGVETTLGSSSVNCDFKVADITGHDTGNIMHLITAVDEHVCASQCARLSNCNGVVWYSDTLVCDMYPLSGFTGFQTGVGRPTVCIRVQVPAGFNPPGKTTNKCGIQGLTGNSIGCLTPSVIPNVFVYPNPNQFLQNTLGNGQALTLIATGIASSSYYICLWQRGTFYQSTDQGGHIGIYNSATMVGFFPSQCVNWNNASVTVNGVTDPAFITIDSILIRPPTSWIIRGDQLFTQLIYTQSVQFAGLTIQADYVNGPYLIPPVPASNQFAQLWPEALGWVIGFPPLGFGTEDVQLNFYPDFFGDSNTNPQHYVIEQFATNNRMECIGRMFANLLAAAVFFVPGAPHGLCSLFSNFGYGLYGENLSAQRFAPGAFAWRRADVTTLLGGASVDYLLSSLDSNIGPFVWNLYAPWAPGNRGYAVFPGEVVFGGGGGFSNVGNSGNGAFAIGEPNAGVPDGSSAKEKTANMIWIASKQTHGGNTATVLIRDPGGSFCNSFALASLQATPCGTGSDAVTMDIYSDFNSHRANTYANDIFWLNVVVLGGGHDVGTNPRMHPSGPDIGYFNGFTAALSIAPYYNGAATPGPWSDANTKFLCVTSASQTGNSGTLPLFTLRDVSTMPDGFGTVFAALNSQSQPSSMSSLPRDCVFHIENTGQLDNNIY